MKNFDGAITLKRILDGGTETFSFCIEENGETILFLNLERGAVRKLLDNLNRVATDYSSGTRILFNYTTDH
jgi:hypothetical protein